MILECMKLAAVERVQQDLAYSNLLLKAFKCVGKGTEHFCSNLAVNRDTGPSPSPPAGLPSSSFFPQSLPHKVPAKLPHTEKKKHFPKVDVGGWGGGCFLCQQPSLSGPDIWLPHHAKARAACGWLIWGTPVSCWLQLLPPWDLGFPVCDQGLGLGPCVKLQSTQWLMDIPEVMDFNLPWQWGQSPFSPAPWGCHCLWKTVAPHCWCPDLPTASTHSHKIVHVFTGKFTWHFSLVENTSWTTSPSTLHRPRRTSVSTKP